MTTGPHHDTHAEHGASQMTSLSAITASERDNSQSHTSDMIYREEEELYLSLQLLTYLSKYAHTHVRFSNRDWRTRSSTYFSLLRHLID